MVGAVSANGDGTYAVNFNVTMIGAYSISTKVNGVDIKRSPFNVEVVANIIQPGLTTLSGGGTSVAAAGRKAFISFAGVDAYANPSANLGTSGQITITIGITVAITTGATVNAATYPDGVFVLGYTTSKSGQHPMTVTFLPASGGSELPVAFKGTPLSIWVPADVVAPAYTTLAETSNLGSLVAGVAGSFKVQPRDRFNNVVSNDSLWRKAHGNPHLANTVKVLCYRTEMQGPRKPPACPLLCI